MAQPPDSGAGKPGQPGGPPARTPSRPSIPAVGKPAAPVIPPVAPAAARPAVPRIAPSVPGIAPVVPPVGPARPAVAGAKPPAAPPRAAIAPPPPAPPAQGSADFGGLTDTQLVELEAMASVLNGLDYFQILKLTPAATPAEIKKAFYQESRAYHPDRFFQVKHQVLKERVNDVYKRITEAYAVLRDDQKRKRYQADITGPEREKKLRFTENSEAETKAHAKKEADEQIGTHPKGRQFFQTGMQDFEAGRWSAAERNFKMAMTYEPSNARYKEKLLEAQDKINGESKQRGDAFKIR